MANEPLSKAEQVEIERAIHARNPPPPRQPRPKLDGVKTVPMTEQETRESEARYIASKQSSRTRTGPRPRINVYDDDVRYCDTSVSPRAHLNRGLNNATPPEYETWCGLVLYQWTPATTETWCQLCTIRRTNRQAAATALHNARTAATNAVMRIRPRPPDQHRPATGPYVIPLKADTEPTEPAEPTEQEPS